MTTMRKHAWAAAGVMGALGASVAASGAVGPAAIAGGTVMVAGVAVAVWLARWRRASASAEVETTLSPWLLIAAGFTVASALPVVLGGGARLAAPAPGLWAALVLSSSFLIAGLIGLLRQRAPQHGLDLFLGASLAPVTMGFVLWVMLLELPHDAGVSPSLLTVGVLAVVVDIALLAAMATLWRFDDDQRPAVIVAALAVVAQTGEHVLQGASTRFGGVDPRWGPAAAVLSVGLWLAATMHPAATAEVPHQTSPQGSLGHAQRLLITLTALMGGPALVVVYARRGSIGQPLWVACGSAAVTVLVVVYLLRLAQRAARLEHLAQHDELTGLANRSLYMDRLRLALARARRAQDGVAVLFVDLDRFKQINDSLGHSAGNEVLRIAATRLCRVIGEHDRVARVGGDEFTVLLPDVSDDTGMSRVCKSIVRAFERPFVLQHDEVFVTASIGVARYPEAGRDPETLVKNADAAMYKAKRRGRDTFEVYTRQINSLSKDRLSLETRLHSAIERDELQLFYQPKVAFDGGAIVGVEALVRWQHPERGMLAPASFVPLAEESGLIVQMDEWALERACTQAKEWQRGYPAFAMAVNLSARHFQQRNVQDMVASVLRRTGLDPAFLELELTETLAQDDLEATRATLFELKDMGVHCSIDDFGTGYSGLSSLGRLPIDRLKIDKSFVERIADDKEALVTAVITLGHGLNLEVTAEGVETLSQFEFLRDQGCDAMQGYLFSKPLPPEKLATLLTPNQPRELVIARAC